MTSFGADPSALDHDLYGVVDLRQVMFLKGDVHHRTNDLDHVADMLILWLWHDSLP